MNTDEDHWSPLKINENQKNKKNKKLAIKFVKKSEKKWKNWPSLGDPPDPAPIIKAWLTRFLEKEMNGGEGASVQKCKLDNFLIRNCYAEGSRGSPRGSKRGPGGLVWGKSVFWIWLMIWSAGTPVFRVLQGIPGGGDRKMPNLAFSGFSGFSGGPKKVENWPKNGRKKVGFRPQNFMKFLQFFLFFPWWSWIFLKNY